MSDNKKLVSVIMSVKDAEETLEVAVNSILEQTYKDFELLIMDDFSKDGTKNILNKFAERDNRIKVFENNSNLGLTRSLNKLIENSSGKYIARQDADDYSTPDRLQIQVTNIEKEDVDAVVCRAKVTGSAKKIPGVSFFFPKKLLMKFKNPFIHGTLLIKKKVLNDLGNYDEKFIYSQDYKLFFDFLNSGYKIKNLNKILYYLNMENNISTNFSSEQKYYADCVRKNISP